MPCPGPVVPSALLELSSSKATTKEKQKKLRPRVGVALCALVFVYKRRPRKVEPNKIPTAKKRKNNDRLSPVLRIYRRKSFDSF